MLKDPWVTRFANDLSDPIVIAATAIGELRHGSVSGTLGFAGLARAAGQGDFIFDYRGVAVANTDHANVYGRSRDRIFKNPMTTAAAVDRLVHHSVILEFDVPSYRALTHRFCYQGAERCLI